MRRSRLDGLTATANINSNIVKDIIGGTVVVNKTVEFGTYIGQHNQG